MRNQSCRRVEVDEVVSSEFSVTKEGQRDHLQGTAFACTCPLRHMALESWIGVEATRYLG